mgnify:CR=1 FL=1
MTDIIVFILVINGLTSIVVHDLVRKQIVKLYKENNIDPYFPLGKNFSYAGPFGSIGMLRSFFKFDKYKDQRKRIKKYIILKITSNVQFFVINPVLVYLIYRIQ